MINIESAINYINDNFSRKRALFIGLAGIIVFSVPIENTLKLLITNDLYRECICPAGCIIWFAYWLYKRNRLPQNKKGRIGIVICITAENDKQKVRLKNDFVKRLRDQINARKLTKNIDIILFSDFHAECVVKVLDEYARNKGAKGSDKQWDKIQARVQGHFYAYGSIKERLDGENNYYLDLEAIVVHAKVNEAAQKEIQQDFLKVWYKTIEIQEKIEFKGFNFAADSIFIAVQYIVGIAALVSGEIYAALELHTSLENDPYFTKFSKLPPNLVAVKEKLRLLLSEENYQVARRLYDQGKAKEAEQYLEKAFLIDKSYGAYLMKSIIAFEQKNNPDEALEWVNKAKPLGGAVDGTWRYNEAFLLMYKGEYKKALAIYKDISLISYEGEEYPLRTVIEFNKKNVNMNPEKVQSYFILGYLKYKKEKNYPEAYEYMNQYLDKSDNDEKNRILRDEANIILAELKHQMGL